MDKELNSLHVFSCRLCLSVLSQILRKFDLQECFLNFFVCVCDDMTHCTFLVNHSTIINTVQSQFVNEYHCLRVINMTVGLKMTRVRYGKQIADLLLENSW